MPWISIEMVIHRDAGRALAIALALAHWRVRLRRGPGPTDCLIDVDGEPLLDRLIDLAVLAGERHLPIAFQ